MSERHWIVENGLAKETRSATDYAALPQNLPSTWNESGHFGRDVDHFAGAD